MTMYFDGTSLSRDEADEALDELLAAADAAILRDLEDPVALDARLAAIFRTVVVPENIEEELAQRKQGTWEHDVQVATGVAAGNNDVDLFLAHLNRVLDVLGEIQWELDVPEVVSDFVDACESDLQKVMRGLSRRTLDHEEARERLQRVLDNIQKCRGLLVHEGGAINGTSHAMIRVISLLERVARDLATAVPTARLLFDFVPDHEFETVQ
ncbi:hypothetical protein [Streptomyces sp. NPDC003077]|uniref:hypothetical protein n=1 Tax=Streptomyces sp. NPDC003077 TaxID=3154443 RepID=UPI0033B39222